MDVFEAAAKRIEVKEYQDKPVSKDTIEKILEAGRLSPSAMNMQPWRFIVVRDKDTLRKISDLSPAGRYIANAAFVIAIAVNLNDKWYQIDSARAVQSMMLVAWSLGVGSRWVGGIERDEIKKMLKIPKQLHLLTVIPFGYPKHPVKGIKNRKPLHEVAYLERYGEPWSKQIE
jgi:nitroreductase